MEEPVVHINDYGSFTEEHLAIAKTLSNKKAYSHLYPEKVGDNEDMPSLVFVDTILMDSDAIQRKSIHGHEQESRASGLNPEYPKLQSSINGSGWKLWGFPISVREVDGKYYFMDGRTKDFILGERHFKNRIVNVYRCNSKDALNFGIEANFTALPAGVAKEEDVIRTAWQAIAEGWLEHDADQILAWVTRRCRRSSISNLKQNQLRWRIFHGIGNQTGRLARAWANASEVKAWLKTHNYIDNHKIIYLPFAASSPSKALLSAAELAVENPTKKIRIVLYLYKLEGYDLKQCYVNAILKFKRIYRGKLSAISYAFFKGSIPLNDRIELYGVVPSNIDFVCPNMDKMIIFGKNDKNISSKFLDTLKLNGVFDLVTSDEEDEEVED